ncbi:regulatory protein RecX [Desulfuromonas acetoxidans]|uniref:Regulatory protein RecX n=1 Tax=Desulfuromonas acetoxidans (strain DSM 684 / 11070) TaxID=281689 RepID=Q1K3C2_DESA6|nr:regulatory protein RecX [Desulfuromonas acetoxidans]EAT17052.1 regulatory protein RecX [Desulfuromonas acetoxidans DSM 684]MBF0645138.1 regulatory protein RecX [Desulfuromonas acetoxidans]NVD24058.1 regulatory protein RecX [Desulfuromonas acetoxidans]NVE16354.1 regulatory protein RecX [Desulfuromonas acetoxidans]
MTAPDAYALCLRWLTRRARCEADLRRRLQQRGCVDNDIEQALQRCRELGYIDDPRFAVERASQLMRQGRAVGPRLLMELKKEGLPETLATEAVQHCHEHYDQMDLLADLVERRYAKLDFTALEDRDKRRIINYLQRRGFPLAMILDHLKEKERQID